MMRALSEPRTSLIETTVFNVLAYVLGCGRQDVPTAFDGRMNLDMLFQAPDGFRLGVEYDGAYWHSGREHADSRKTHLLLDSGLVNAVMRIREEPLDRITSLDLVVPKAASGQEVARLALLHVAHTVQSSFGRRAWELLEHHVALEVDGRMSRSLFAECQ